ncbi:carboxypeptidase-like regulatory domain-containing protein [Aquirufa sp. ROCK2-A2]
MKKIFTQIVPCFVVFMMLSLSVFAQTKLSGKVTDAASNEALIGVSIAVKGKVIGTITDANGSFSLTTSTPAPFTISVSMVGYERQEIVVKGAKTDFAIKLKEQATLGQDIVVSASRIEESVLQSPVSIEKLDIRGIRETPSASFYDALKNIKGVEMSTQSVSFSSVSMRGFNGNGNVRVVQMIDGMDNQAPGLNFSVGNIVGISELDLEGLELLPGAASALYGPNAMNGILLMNSKSPFLYQGLSAQVKAGAMYAGNRTTAMTPYGDISLRYAKAINNKWAYKVNFNMLTADDWQATDYRDQSLLNGTSLGAGDRVSNLAYNGVNVYGDETNANLYSSLLPILGDPSSPITSNVKLISALTGKTANEIFGSFIPNMTISREGYKEVDLASYANRNIKFNAALHYRFNDKVELILQGSYGQGTTVYTGIDRYAIKNFSMGQYKAELKGANFFLRGYTTQENSGDAYSIGTLGAIINEYAKPSSVKLPDGSSAGWYPSFFQTFAGLSFTKFATEFQTNLMKGQNPTSALTNATATNAASYPYYFGTARQIANSPSKIGGIDFPGVLTPGTAAFNSAVEQVKQSAIPKGAKFTDKTALYHLEGMYNLTEKFNNKLELIVGANYRQYALNSEGSLFALDNAGKEFSINEYGAYTQLGKKVLSDKLKLTGSIRFDKNENFDGVFSPRFSGVYTEGRSNFRASYQTGFRIPTTQDQYIDLNTPTARLLGGLDAVQNRYKLSGNSYTRESLAAGKPELYQAKTWKPEQVQTYEFGYKGFLGDRLLADFYWYQSNYTNFSGGRVVVQTPDQHKEGPFNKVFSFPSNIDNTVITNGWALGLDYQLGANWTLGSNVSYNAVKDNGGATDAQIGFNTPAYRTNVSLGNRNIAASGWGVNVTWRYQDQFVWNSSVVSQAVSLAQQSLIPAYQTVDAQISKKLSGMKSILKVGGTNLFGTPYTTSWANPIVGSIYYVSLTFDELLNK